MSTPGRVKTLIFASVPTLLLLVAADAAIRYWYGESTWKLAGDKFVRRVAAERVVFREPLAQSDKVTGYACVPGTHHVELVKGLDRIDFRATIGADGYRITSRMGPADRHSPQAWIAGCSYTWGLGVNDEETYPWLVQAALPSLHVRNLGGNGFGNIQALLQLRSAVERGEVLPKIAVIVYNDFDLSRNVASPSYLEMMNGSTSAFTHTEINVARAFLDGQGSLNVGWEKLFQPIPPGSTEPSVKSEEAVTRKILDDIRELCLRHGITPVFAIQSRPDGDPILGHARDTGWTIADLWLDLDARAGTRYRLMPVDAHPNSSAHRVYAARLLKTLRSLGL